MLQAFLNMWRIADLRGKMLFTIGMLVIYRVGFFIPLPAVSQARLQDWAQKNAGGPTGNLVQFMGIFTGGALDQSTLFALGIMPYISASIIMQLLGTVVESIKKLRDEGPAGQQKIQEYTRYLTVGISLVQSVAWLSTLQGSGSVVPQYAGTATFWICGMVGLTAGAVFLMWLGEQIDKFGIGNGASLIITAGIVARMGDAILSITSGSDFPKYVAAIPGGFAQNVAIFFNAGRPIDPAQASQYGLGTVVFLTAAFVFVVAGAVLITQGQRRIPIQQAKHTRGRKVYGGQKMFLPLRVNHGGVMPIIFASALMTFPSIILAYLIQGSQHPVLLFLSRNFSSNSFMYILIFIGMIYFFAYFWTSVQFQPHEMAKNLRNNGSFVPGLRPGPRTAEYLETVMERITYVGAGFLAVIAVIPMVVSGYFGVDVGVSAFLGGTGLLICVSVVLDMVQRLEANLAMRNYKGFLE